MTSLHNLRSALRLEKEFLTTLPKDSNLARTNGWHSQKLSTELFFSFLKLARPYAH